MTEKPYDRADLKRACLQILDAKGVEHPAGHQGKLAARYVLRDAKGGAIELMFEKGPATPANLWMSRVCAEKFLDSGVAFRHSPATDLYAAADTNGKPRYGRHSALKPMQQLADTDLVCFTIERPGEIERLLACLTLTTYAEHRPDINQS